MCGQTYGTLNLSKGHIALSLASVLVSLTLTFILLFTYISGHDINV